MPTDYKKTKGSARPQGFDPALGKVPPQSVEIEEAVLGAILLDKDAVHTAGEILTPGAFYNTAHNLVYDAARDLAGKGIPVDMLTVMNHLKAAGTLEQIGGAYALVKLTNNVVSAANLETHCRIVQEKFIRREMIRVGIEIVSQAYDESQDTFEVLGEAERGITEIGQTNAPGVSLDMATVMMQAMQKIEYWRGLESHVTGVPSGFREIDRATRGWQPGDLIIIAARPSVGKTAFALNLAANAAVSGHPVGLWSLEMKAVTQGLRMLSAQSGMLMSKIQSGKVSDQEIGELNRGAVDTLSGLPIYINDTISQNLAKFRTEARRLVKKKGVKLIIVDYLQLMTGEERQGTNREQEISKISRTFKKIAMELDVPFIALSQLSREVEKRTNKTPMLSDLRESGSLEQDADLVAFLYANSEEDIKNNPALFKQRKVKISKQRNGTLLDVDLEFKNEIQKFSDPVPEGLPEGRWSKVPKAEQSDLPF